MNGLTGDHWILQEVLAMSDSPVLFNRDSAKRIANATRRIERMPQDRTGGRNPSPAPAEQTFWVRLLGRSIDGKLHSWQRVRPDGAGGWQTYQPPVQGELNAVEVNGHIGIESGVIVQLSLTDYDPDGKPLYSFVFTTPDINRPMPIHDHRDNDNGGFAFAVFHPGTSLPQQRFGI